MLNASVRVYPWHVASWPRATPPIAADTYNPLTSTSTRLVSLGNVSLCLVASLQPEAIRLSRFDVKRFDVPHDWYTERMRQREGVRGREEEHCNVHKLMAWFDDYRADLALERAKRVYLRAKTWLQHSTTRHSDGRRSQRAKTTRGEGVVKGEEGIGLHFRFMASKKTARQTDAARRQQLRHVAHSEE